MIQTMAPLPRGDLSPSSDDDTHLMFVAAFANAMCNAALADCFDTAGEHIVELAARSQAVWKLAPDDLETAFEEANNLSVNYARLLKVAPETQPSLQRLARPFTFTAEPNLDVEAPANARAAR